MVVGNRLVQLGDKSFRPLHVFGNRLVVSCVNHVFGSHLTDLMSGYRVYTRELVRSVPVMSHGFEVETERTLQTLYRGFVIAEVPVPYAEVPPGSFSKLSTCRDGFKGLVKNLDIFKAYRPLAFFTLMALILAAVGLALGAVPVVEFIQTGKVSRFPTALQAAAIEICAIVTLSCGIVLDAVNRRFLVVAQQIKQQSGERRRLLAAALPLDVGQSTYPAANALANGFASLGTALVLFGDRTRLRRWGAVALGLSVFVHVSPLFFLGCLVLVFGLRHGLRRPVIADLREAAVLRALALSTFLTFEFSTMQVLVGDPLWQLRIVGETHLSDAAFAIPMRLPDGSMNPDWLTWPVTSLVFSRGFGLTLGLPVLFVLFRSEAVLKPVRWAAALVVCFWVFTSYGSQHPLNYVPLDRDTRYWYPVALPALVVLTFALSRLPTHRWRRIGVVLALAASLLLLLSAGPWGQNVEITKELLTFAEARPEVVFATDGDTLDEMFILRGGRLPENVKALDGRSARWTFAL